MITFKMIIPIMILVLFSGLSLGIDTVKHGKKKNGKYNIWTTLLAHAIQWGLILWIIFSK